MYGESEFDYMEFIDNDTESQGDELINVLDLDQVQ